MGSRKKRRKLSVCLWNYVFTSPCYVPTDSVYRNFKSFMVTRTEQLSNGVSCQKGGYLILSCNFVLWIRCLTYIVKILSLTAWR